MLSYVTAAEEAAAAEDLHRRQLTDGLPVVVPTHSRVEEMILASGHDAELSLGAVGPSYAAATIEVVAANAVMAGCLPQHFPVVLAAVRAACDPRFDLTEIQVTTHPITPPSYWSTGQCASWLASPRGTVPSGLVIAPMLA